MADYLVLEEDGTSRVEMEEDTSDLLIEETGYESVELVGPFDPHLSPAAMF